MYDTIIDLVSAIEEFEFSLADVAADNPGASPDDYAWDICVSVALRCDEDTARELCRTQLGAIPQDVLRSFPDMEPMPEF
jgi:hypothetical protein